MKTLRPLAALALALTASSLALAQPKVNAAAPVPANPPVTPNMPDLPPTPTVQTGASGNATTAPGTTIGAFNGTSATTARTAPGSNLPVSARTAAEADARVAPLTPASPGTTRANANVTLAPATALNAAPVGNNTAVTIDTTRTIAEIESAPFKARAEVAANLASRIDTSTEAIAALQAQVAANGGAAREEFALALNEVRARERQLRSSARALGSASSESAWSAAQSTLARDYNAYAEAVAHAEAAAQGSVTASATKR